jgi:hypothetical protein
MLNVIDCRCRDEERVLDFGLLSLSNLFRIPDFALRAFLDAMNPLGFPWEIPERLLA